MITNVLLTGFMPHVFLNPDDTQPWSAFVVVRHATGVTYGHQCAGLHCDNRSIEGFLIPVGGPTVSDALFRWFDKIWGGHVTWTPERVESLSKLVAGIPCWLTVEKGEDRRDFLRLDTELLDECFEGWVPVETPYGRGVLLFENSD